MKKLSILLAGTSLALGVGAAQADQLDDIREAGVLVCGVPSNYVPFSYLESDNDRTPVGFDVDVCNAIAEHLGVTPELRYVTGASRIPDLTAGRIDIATAALTITPERAQQVDFSIPYFRTGVRVSVPNDSDITEMDQLNGHRIAVPESGMASMIVEERFPDSAAVGFPTPANTFLALQRGMVQAMAGDETTLLGQMSGAPGEYHLLDGFLTDDWLGVGVRKGEGALLEAVNEALLGMEADGSAVASFNRFFGADTPMGMERNFTINTDNIPAE